MHSPRLDKEESDYKLWKHVQSAVYCPPPTWIAKLTVKMYQQRMGLGLHAICLLQRQIIMNSKTIHHKFTQNRHQALV